jgi:protoporphyrinogen IX oxidase
VPTFYLALKAFHIIFIVTWFAGIFYFPRLLIYHRQAQDQTTRSMFEVMERKLYRIIMNPSMVATLIFGASLLFIRWEGIRADGWIWVKLAAVMILLGYHHYCALLMRKFAMAEATGEPPVTDKFLRIFNEIPALLLVIIVLLAVTKPF